MNAITLSSKFSACRPPVNSLDMYYEISGEGSPAVFIHPFASYGSVHGDLLPRTIPNRSWITMDLQGHGRTPDIDRSMSYEQGADDVAALLRYLGVEEVDVFGESKGGIVAVVLALRHPELVRRVAIYGSVLGRFEEITRPESRAAFMTLTPEHHSVQFQRENYERVAPDPTRWPQLFAKATPEPAQVMLILHILCGLGVAEVASAFMSSYAATEKRLVRAKKVLADAPGLFDVSAPEDVAGRLPGVQRALYLLFNEGYHGASAQSAVRPDICREAMHLTAILVQDARAATPASYALAALMSLHAARLPARRDAAGELLPLSEQDRSRWDQKLIAEGIKLISLSAQGPQLSEYHLEAAIASVHAAATSAADTDWTRIVGLYDQLLALRSSPVIALNRAIAVAQANGAEQGLRAIHLIKDVECLAAYPFYAAALGELELRCRRRKTALDYFTRALQLARNPAEHRFFTRKVEQCGAGIDRRSMDTYGELAARIDPL